DVYKRQRLYSVKQAFAVQVRKLLENLSGERYKCLRGKAQGLLADLPATVLNPRCGINVHAEGYSIKAFFSIRDGGRNVGKLSNGMEENVSSANLKKIYKYIIVSTISRNLWEP
ncbi:MAG: hypothetical protein N2513_10560, partial [Deltaproteobacteria bacterium]|nr:hypothetical protein [Deltaproteobacteria bacterium]